MRTSLFLLLTIGIAIGAMSFFSDDRSRTPPPSAAAAWPTEFEGRALTQVPLSDAESAFAGSFPGAIGVFRSTGDRQLILRRVDRATRRLHSSATCLKSAGFQIDERELRAGWLRYRASKGAQVLRVREQITNRAETDSWTEVSGWFWHALFKRDSGPWTAVTVIDPFE